MERDEIRLECLRLAHAHGRTDAEVVNRAKVYEGFILDAKDESASVKASSPNSAVKKPKQKVTGNSDILS